MSRSVCTNRSSIVLMSLEKKPMAQVLFVGAWSLTQTKNGQSPGLFLSTNDCNARDATVPGTFRTAAAHAEAAERRRTCPPRVRNLDTGARFGDEMHGEIGCETLVEIHH